MQRATSTTARVAVPAPRRAPDRQVEDWTAVAACADTAPDDLFVQGAAQHQAKRVCRTCPVQLDCLSDALDNRVEFGVWGGLTERERRALLARRPDVASWRDVLMGDRAAQALHPLRPRRAG